MVYFDGFAGSGSNNQESINEFDKNIQLFLQENEQEFKLYKESAERILRLDKKFDTYYFIDADSQSLRNLQEHLRTQGYNLNNCQFKPNDVNSIKEFCRNYTKRKAILIVTRSFWNASKME